MASESEIEAAAKIIGEVVKVGARDLARRVLDAVEQSRGDQPSGPPFLAESDRRYWTGMDTRQ